MRLDVQILGPLRVEVERAPAALTGRVSALLALLVVHRGDVLDAGRIADALWEGEPPPGASQTVRSYVAQLRRSLGPAAAAVQTMRPGYRIDPTGLCVDADELETHLAEARAAMAAETPARALAVLDRTRALLRGPPLGDLADAAWARAEASRLVELGWSATELRVDALLALERPAEALADLEVACAEAPLREGLWLRRMTALHRSGRQTEALRAYQDLRARLAEEIGVEPAPELQRLEARILAQDGSLSGPSMRPPSSVVALVFTDLVGSTRRWRDDPASARQVLERHDETVRAAVSAHGGREFKHTGDGICAAFPRPADALSAAATLQERLVAEGVEARVAVHAGEVESRGDDLAGPALNRAARLLDAANPGQCLVSAAVAALHDDDPRAGFGLVGLGRHEVRDLGPPQALFSLRRDGTPADGRPPRLPATTPSWPVPATSLVGRTTLVATLVPAVASAPVTTLTGVGGVGKTRLALAVGDALRDAFEGGRIFCELGPVTSPDGVEPAVAAALGVLAGDRPGLRAAIVDRCRDLPTLLVLDNCEHLLSPVAGLAAELVTACPRLRILATSREGLAVPGERLVTVPSLGTGSADAEGESLFVERARQTVAGYQPGPEDRTAITEICDRLDGVPLAIELAARRIKVLTAPEIAAHLDERFRLLTGSTRATVERHRTLAATLDWSYRLLDPTEQRALSALSVFRGAFPLAAAATVLSAAEVDRPALEVLSSLVDKSLVEVVRAIGVTRYRLTETIRAYAVERLGSEGLADPVRRHHAGWCRALTEEAGRRAAAGDETGAASSLERHLADLDAAADWLIGSGGAQRAIDLLAPLRWAALPETVERLASGWAERALELADAERHPGHAVVATNVALARLFRGSSEQALRLLRRAAELVAERGERPDPMLRFALGFATFVSGDAPGALAMARSIASEAEQPEDAYPLAGGAVIELDLGDPVRARSMAERSVELAGRSRRPSTRQWALTTAATVIGGSDPGRAGRWCESATREPTARRAGLAVALGRLATLTEGEAEAASLRRLRPILAELDRSGAPPDDAGPLLFDVVRLLTAKGEAEAAGRLLGAMRDGRLPSPDLARWDDQRLAAHAASLSFELPAVSTPPGDWSAREILADALASLDRRLGPDRSVRAGGRAPRPAAPG